ncbi:MAG: site-specific DNA-methyltransferase [Verrucomicrobia bacterium]|nr:site-specific DNA-methyltransferase [Verrucomicrobiota bacterium]
MQKLTAHDPETKSPDFAAANIAALRALFPELLTEGQDGVAVNLDVLKQLVGDKTVTDAEEKYGLNWHGKRRARQLALTPSTGTLRPCPEDSVDWDTTQNLMIEGDNLEVLKLLQKSYAGKVKLIYIDPPYNTGKDFVYPDNFQDNIKNYLELTGQTGEGGKKLSSNTEASGRFHTDWLNMMYPRLKLARNLLREDGVIFASIEQTELANLLKAFDDVFGEENTLGCLIWRKKEGGGMADANFATEHEYVVAYRKGEAFVWGDESIEQDESDFARSDEKGQYKLVKLAKWGNTARREDRPSMYFGIVDPDGNPNYPVAPDGSEGRWRVGRTRFDELLNGSLVEFQKRDGKWVPYEKIYFDPAAVKSVKLRSILYETGGTAVGTNELTELFGLKDVFQNPKPTKLISSFSFHNTNPDAIVLDFFAGSGTTGHSVLNQNAADDGTRRYILVQLPESLSPDNKDQKVAADYCDKLKKPRTIAELTKERLRRAGKKIREENPLFAGDLGFRVFKLASSNIRAWEPDRDKLAETLEASIEHLKTDRTEQDILFELLLKLGLDLCVPIETRIFYHEKHEAHEKGGDQKVEAMMSLHPQDFRAFRVFRGSAAESPEGSHTVHSIGGGSLLVCLSPSIPQADVEPLALGLVAWHKELKPAGETTVVFRDSAFADDVAKTNLTAILHQHGLETVRSL